MKDLVYPAAFYFFYIWALALLNFVTRYLAVKKGKVSHRFFKAYLGEIPERVQIVGRHYDNQFQLPVLFFVTVSYLLILDIANRTSVILAWLFVISRIIHTGIHLGKNRVLRRAACYAMSWLFVLALWTQILYAVH